MWLVVGLKIDERSQRFIDIINMIKCEKQVPSNECVDKTVEDVGEGEGEGEG